MGVATKSIVRNATPTVIFSISANGERTFPVKVRQTPIMAVRVSHGFPAFPRSSLTRHARHDSLPRPFVPLSLRKTTRKSKKHKKEKKSDRSGRQSIGITEGSLELSWRTNDDIMEIWENKDFGNASGELDITVVHSILEYTAADGKSYKTGFYNLDAILSIGYRVNSRQATRFRQWANTVLKEYLIKGISFNARLLQLSADIDRRLTTHAIKLNEHECRLKEQSKKIDFVIQSSLPPKQGIFFDGQIYDAYAFVADLVRKAGRRIVLIDNYIDDTVLTLLSKRAAGVEVVIYTAKISKQLQLDIDKHNAQYPQVEVRTFSKTHDRFLIIDDTVYLVGASIKDLGKKWFGFTLMENTDAEELLGKI